jgi:hypothetical protein
MFFFNVLITTAMFLDRYKSQVVGGHKCETRIPVVFNYSYVGIECYIIRERLLGVLCFYVKNMYTIYICQVSDLFTAVLK